MPLIVTPRQFTQRAEFYHQLAQCTSAGIGVIQALEQIKASPPARSFREPLQRLLDELAKGATLAESLQQLGWLPAFDLALMEPANAADGSMPVSACSPIITMTAPASSRR